MYLVHPAPAIDIRKRGAKAAKWLTRMGAGEVATQIAPAKGEPPVAALHEAAANVVGAQVRLITIPRRFATPMREIWELQHRLESRRSPQRLLSHPRFRASYDFLLLREQAGEDLDGAGHWWTQLQAGEEPAAPRSDEDSAPVRRRRRRKPRGGARSDAG